MEHSVTKLKEYLLQTEIFFIKKNYKKKLQKKFAKKIYKKNSQN